MEMCDLPHVLTQDFEKVSQKCVTDRSVKKKRTGKIATIRILKKTGKKLLLVFTAFGM
jgi:hypothetical protein